MRTTVLMVSLQYPSDNLCSLMTLLEWLGYFFLKEKLEAFNKFKAFKTLVEDEKEAKIKCLRSDNGGEFTSKEFDLFPKTHGIKRQFTAAITP